ncbi:MAG: PDZ domain-containing protein [Candidatus Saccharicenans sp.]|nr:PDZ domain-containing protein [Candidatus Saccharicenans sp.]
MKASLRRAVHKFVLLFLDINFLLFVAVCLSTLVKASPAARPETTVRVGPVQKYRGFEVKTGLLNDQVQYSLLKENFVEFTINGDCQLESVRIMVGGQEFRYGKAEKVIEDGRIEKNDLFAYICYQPEVLNDSQASPEEVQFKFYRGKISPVINPEYPLYATLKLSAERQGINLPHRTFVVLNGLGTASHEFFCYLEGTGKAIPEADSCAVPFEQVLETHYRNSNAVALMDLGDKYARRLDYEKAEKSYLKALALPGQDDHGRLVEIYLDSGQAARARQYLQGLLKRSPMDFNLRLLLAQVYLYEKAYDNAIEEAEASLKLPAERGRYQSYAISGRAQLGKRNFVEAIKALGRAAVLAEKECQESRELWDKFFRQEQEQQASDCRLARLPYEQLIVYALLNLEEYERAERGAEALVKVSASDPYNYGWLAFATAALGKFDKALEQADRCLAFFRRKGIGAAIARGEIYPQVISVQKGTPADRAGLNRGDRIIAVNGQDLRFFREQEEPDQALARLVRKEERVKLTVHPPGSAELKVVEVGSEEFLSEQAGPVVRLKELIEKSKSRVDPAAFRKLLYELAGL